MIGNVLQFKLNELTPSHAKVIRCLRFVIVQHDKLCAVESRIVLHIREHLRSGFLIYRLHLTLLIIDVGRRHEVGIVVQLSIIAERQKISTCCPAVVQSNAVCAEIVDRSEGVLSLQNVLSWIHEGTRHETFLAISSNDPIPIWVFFVKD